MIDNEMLAMFFEEARENLEQAENCLLRLEENSRDSEAIAELFRALHTLKGTATMMGFQPLATIAHQSESMVSLYRDQGVTVTQQGIDLLLQVVDNLSSMVDAIEDSGQCPDYPPDLLTRLQEFCATAGQQDEQTDAFSRQESAGSSDEQESVESEGEVDAQDTTASSVSAHEQEQDDSAESLDVLFFVFDEELPGLEQEIDALLNDEGEWQRVLTRLKIMMPIAMRAAAHDMRALLEEIRQLSPEQDDFKARLKELRDNLLRSYSELKGEDQSHESLEEEVGFDETDVEEHKEDREYPAGSDGESDAQNAVSDAEDDFFAETGQYTLDVDDQDLAAFLVFLESELPVFKNGLEEFATEGKKENFLQSVETIRYAARQIGLKAIVELMENMGSLADMEEQQVRELLPELENELVEQIEVLETLARERGIAAGPTEQDLTSLFVSGLIAGAEAMNARLKESADMLQTSLELLRQGKEIDLDSAVIQQAVLALRQLYHFTLFYKLEPATELVLILEDLLGRILQREFFPEKEFLDLIADFALQMQDVFDRLSSGEKLEHKPFRPLLERARSCLRGTPEDVITGLSERFLDALDISDGFVEVLTPENKKEIAEALQRRDKFYEVLVDLDNYPESIEEFMALKEEVKVISSITVYRDAEHHEQPLYNFLIAAQMSKDELYERLQSIFGQEDAFQLRVCGLKDDVAVDMLDDTRYIQQQRSWANVDLERYHSSLTQLARGADEIATVTSVIRYVINSLEQIDFEDVLTTVAENASDEYKNNLIYIAEQLRNLVAVDKHMSTALDDLQTSLQELRTSPAGELLQWMVVTLQEGASADGVKVDITRHGDEERLSTSLLEPLKKILKGILLTWMRELSEKTDQTVYILVRVSGRDDVNFISMEVSEAIDLNYVPDVISRVKSELAKYHIELTYNENGFSFCILNLNTMINAIITMNRDVYYVIPVQSVKRILEMKNAQLTTTSCDNSGRMVEVDGELVPVRHIGNEPPASDYVLLVVVEGHQGTVAFEVDEIVGQETLRVLPLMGHLQDIEWARGCAVLGNGSVGLVVNV